MKKFLGALLFAVTAATTHAQVQNGGFEQLNMDVFPMYWQGSPFIQLIWIDSLGVAHGDSVVFDGGLYLLNEVDAHSGSHAMELRNGYNFTTSTTITGDWNASSDTITYGFPLVTTPTTTRPAELSFWGEYFPAGADSAYAEVHVFDEAFNEIGSGTLAIGGTVPNYALFTVPVSYATTDSAAFLSVHFTTASPNSAATFGTRFLIDDVSMAYTATSVEDVSGAEELMLYPNPAQDRFTLRAVEPVRSVQAMDVAGRVHTLWPRGTNTYDCSSLANGHYVLNTGAVRTRFVVAR